VPERSVRDIFSGWRRRATDANDRDLGATARGVGWLTTPLGNPSAGQAAALWPRSHVESLLLTSGARWTAPLRRDTAGHGGVRDSQSAVGSATINWRGPRGALRGDRFGHAATKFTSLDNIRSRGEQRTTFARLEVFRVLTRSSHLLGRLVARVGATTVCPTIYSITSLAMASKRARTKNDASVLVIFVCGQGQRNRHRTWGSGTSPEQQALP